MSRTVQWLLSTFFFCCATTATAQTVIDDLRADVRRAAGLYYSLPTTEPFHDTPPPAGKHPFYINHYGCSSAHYMEQFDYYNLPYQTLSRADSLGKLTALGRDVLGIVSIMRNDAAGRTGELSESGKQHARNVALQMLKRLPEMFTDDCYVDGRSIVQNHHMQTLGEVTLQISRFHQPMQINTIASNRHKSWMNAQDKEIEAHCKDSIAKAGYDDFTARHTPDNSRLMASLFNDADYVKTIHAEKLSRQLFDLACNTVNQAETTSNEPSSSIKSLYDIFTPDEIHDYWMLGNAQNYLHYGHCLLSGGYQPYVQRKPLWNLFHMGDSIMKLDFPVVHIRYTHQGAVLSLVSLLEINNYGVKTSCLDSLETLGWADYRIAPLGGSIMLIHYRTDSNDPDPLVRVLLNGREVQLPIQTDCAPYYHWIDVKRYYLRKLYIYERETNDVE